MHLDIYQLVCFKRGIMIDTLPTTSFQWRLGSNTKLLVSAISVSITTVCHHIFLIFFICTVPLGRCTLLTPLCLQFLAFSLRALGKGLSLFLGPLSGTPYHCFWEKLLWFSVWEKKVRTHLCEIHLCWRVQMCACFSVHCTGGVHVFDSLCVVQVVCVCLCVFLCVDVRYGYDGGVACGVGCGGWGKTSNRRANCPVCCASTQLFLVILELSLLLVCFFKGFPDLFLYISANHITTWCSSGEDCVQSWGKKPSCCCDDWTKWQRATLQRRHISEDDMILWCSKRNFVVPWDMCKMVSYLGQVLVNFFHVRYDGCVD